MSGSFQTHGALSEEKRRLFELLLERRGISVPKAQSIPVRRDGEPLVLSFAQERLWFLHQLQPESPQYNLSAAIRLRGRLDAPALEWALNEIVRRHEALRSAFPMNAVGLSGLAVAAERPLPLELFEPVGTAEPWREEEIAAFAAAEWRRPFDLARGPLLRARLLRLGAEDHVLVVTMHHIVSDAWSVGVFVKELVTLYGARVGGASPSLPELPIQYADFALWQRKHLRGEVLDRHLAYWRERLAGAPSLLKLPTDRPRPAAQSYAGARESFALTRELSHRLEVLGRGEGATLFMTLLASFQALLSYYSGQDDISVGTPIANRKRGETEDLVGFFVNTLVMRTDLSGDPTFLELLRRVRAVASEAYAHQDLPFERLVEELQPTRDFSHHPLFQVWFVLQNGLPPEQQLPGLVAEPLAFEKNAVRHDLRLELIESREGLSGSFEYKTDLFDRATVARMTGHYQTLLDHVADRPADSLSELKRVLAEEDQKARAAQESEFREASRLKLQSARRKAVDAR